MSRTLPTRRQEMFRHTPRIRKCVLLALCAFLLTYHALAQTVTGTITGTAVDSTGAVMVGAKVALTDEATGVERQTATGDEGSFVVVGLPPGRYSLHIEMRGFRPI